MRRAADCAHAQRPRLRRPRESSPGSAAHRRAGLRTVRSSAGGSRFRSSNTRACSRAAASPPSRAARRRTRCATDGRGRNRRTARGTSTRTSVPERRIPRQPPAERHVQPTRAEGAAARTAPGGCPGSAVERRRDCAPARCAEPIGQPMEGQPRADRPRDRHVAPPGCQTCTASPASASPCGDERRVVADAAAIRRILRREQMPCRHGIADAAAAAWVRTDVRVLQVRLETETRRGGAGAVGEPTAEVGISEDRRRWHRPAVGRPYRRGDQTAVLSVGQPVADAACVEGHRRRAERRRPRDRPARMARATGSAPRGRRRDAAVDRDRRDPPSRETARRRR